LPQRDILLRDYGVDDFSRIDLHHRILLTLLLLLLLLLPPLPLHGPVLSAPTSQTCRKRRGGGLSYRLIERVPDSSTQQSCLSFKLGRDNSLWKKNDWWFDGNRNR
jgi:hypothetical protein